MVEDISGFLPTYFFIFSLCIAHHLEQSFKGCFWKKKIINDAFLRYFMEL